MFFYVFFLFNFLEVEIFKKQKDRFVCDVKAKAHRLKKYVKNCQFLKEKCRFLSGI